MVWVRYGVMEIKLESVFVTLNETSKTTTDSQVGSGNTYLVPSGGTVDAHRVADITAVRLEHLEDTIFIVSGHVPGSGWTRRRVQAP